MKLKNTAFVSNVTVNGSSNCDWGTDLGQGRKHTFTLEGFPEVLNAMVYYKIEDVENINVILGKGNRTQKKFSEYEGIQLVLASCFNKIYLNDTYLDGQRLVVYILKDVAEKNSKGQPNVHLNRCTLKFSNSLLYNNEPVNQKCIDAISNAFGLSNKGSWVVLEMIICNEDELHLYGFPIDNTPKDYSSIEERNSDFEKRMHEYAKAKRREAFKNYLFAPDTFKTEGAAKNYWKHIDDPFYKERLSFVWDKLSNIIGFKSDDLFEIDNYEDAEKLYNMVQPLQENRDCGNQLPSAILNKYMSFLKNNQLVKSPLSNDKKKNILSSLPLQQIFYGAPGTGKSHKVQEVTDSIAKEFVFRTTFHPDSDYSTFVGAYKPTMANPVNKLYTVGQLIDKLSEIKNTGCTYPCQKFAAKYWYALKQLSSAEVKEIIAACGFTDSMKVEIDKSIPVGEELAKNNTDSKIVYSFVPQAFLNAYVAAWKNQDQPVFLVIEEINRGNCAQIFGDIFQLLDRKDNGESKYPIKADQDIRDYLAKEFAGVEGLENKIQSGEELVLPANLHIWATMNTSDQSLFPIDSAFKRRWDWEYVPIKYANDKWMIDIQGTKYPWVAFQKEVNKRIYNINHSEDKMLGDFFVKADKNDIISQNLFINKILFYLWNDVCKDGEGDIFKINNNQDITFSDLYGPNGNANLIAMMAYLGVKPEKSDEENESIVEDETTN